MLGYHDFLEGLNRGIAAHHAGMLPTFKECVEELFVAGPGARWCSPPRRSRWASTCRRASVVIEKLVEVERRDPRRHHARGVHPAHRPRRPPRHRRRGPRRRAVAARDGPRRWPGWPPPGPTRCGRASGRRTTWRSTWCTSSAGDALARAAGDVVRPVPGRQGGGRARPAAAQGRGGARRATREAATCHLGDFMEYAALRRRITDPEKGAGRARRADRREEAARRRWRSCGPAT